MQYSSLLTILTSWRLFISTVDYVRTLSITKAIIVMILIIIIVGDDYDDKINGGDIS
jgi:hypothetical protein